MGSDPLCLPKNHTAHLPHNPYAPLIRSKSNQFAATRRARAADASGAARKSPFIANRANRNIFTLSPFTSVLIGLLLFPMAECAPLKRANAGAQLRRTSRVGFMVTAIMVIPAAIGRAFPGRRQSRQVSRKHRDPIQPSRRKRRWARERTSRLLRGHTAKGTHRRFIIRSMVERSWRRTAID